MNGIKPMLVVAVDDDPVFIRHMAGAARFHGIPFAGFSSPREAYRELPRLNPGVAIVDYDLGRVTGLQLSRYLGRIGPTPVILVSAGLRPYRGEWPAVVVDFASKALGAEAILGLALKAASGSIKTEGEP